MANIRKQAILSSILVYIGFVIGAINTYFFTREGSFTPEQFGLTRVFYDMGQNIFIFGSLGVIPIVYKFYPYYKDNVPDRQNDLVSWAMVVSFVGFCLVLLTGYVIEPLMVRKFTARSPLILQYYYFIFPFGFGMLFFSVLEAFCWSLHKTVISNFLKETAMRMIVLVFILLFYFNAISFHTFIQLFTLTYFIIFLVLAIYLRRLRKLHFTLRPSRVTLKFKKKMFGLQSLVFGGVCISVIAQTIDTFIIASLKGLGSTGVFNLAQYAANLVQVPQRSIQSISTGVLAQAWKDKDFKEINRIYQRSCINLLLMALFIFCNIWLNIDEAFVVLNIQTEYQEGIWVMFVLGLARLVDAGTGVNGTIIGTSTFWRFDFLSGIVLLAFRIPLTYYLIKNFGIIGSAFAELAAYSLYNFIRFEFLRRRFNMQPFTAKTAYAMLLALATFGVAYLLFGKMEGWTGIILRSAVFSGLLIVGTVVLELSPDAMQLYHKYRDKLVRR